MMFMNINKRWFIFGGIGIVVLLLVFLSVCFFNNINVKVEVVLVDDLTIDFLDERKVSDFIKSINGKIIDDYNIDTTSIGIKNISFKYINDDGIRINYKFDVEVVDRVKPIIWVGNTYTILVNSEDNILSSIMCGDNEDPHPKCSIIGDYNLNKIGVYKVMITAIDRSGNKAFRNISLNVVLKIDNNVKPKSSVSFSSVVSKYKNKNTMIGVDISKWQEDVDFQKLVSNGVSFVILKIGNTDSIGGKPVMDPMFIHNISEASKYNLDIMVYYYSKANSKKLAMEEARWVIKNISKYKVSGIAFDWEDWTSYNKYNLSFYGLSELAYSFLDIVKDKGYDGYLYSSKSYLESIWIKRDNSYYTWLAHYTNETDYSGDYRIWQMCDTGKIDGIKGYVDIDIMYK